MIFQRQILLYICRTIFCFLSGNIQIVILLGKKQMNTTDKPTIQDFHIQGVKHISPVNAMEAVTAGNAILLDVREEFEWKTLSIDIGQILYHPMSVILDRLEKIPVDKPLIVICVSGERSTKIVNLLNRNGFEDVANLDGGIVKWIEEGMPFKSKLSKDQSCGCGCESGASVAKVSQTGCDCSSGCGSGVTVTTLSQTGCDCSSGCGNDCC
jgi:rhodanese-related sulfurtransferase